MQTQVITGHDAVTHFNLLIDYMPAYRFDPADATKESADAFAQKARGYFRSGATWIAFDNSSGDFWTEEFEHEDAAIKWVIEGK